VKWARQGPLEPGDLALPRTLCRLEDIPDGQARGFPLGKRELPDEIFVFRRGSRVFGYVNACPHIGTPLNIIEDKFTTRDRRFLLCQTHGARFRPEDGFCVAGPCKGQHLQGYPVWLESGSVLAD